MKDFIDKISAYNILNYLIPGAIFWYMYPLVCNETLPGGKFIEELFAFYFSGMIIYGIGSIVVEPLFKKLKIVQYANYADYIKASKKDLKLETLSESNNSFRTIIALTFVLFIAKIYSIIRYFINVPTWITLVLLLTAIAVIFSLLYKKRTKFIKTRVEQSKIETEISKSNI